MRLDKISSERLDCLRFPLIAGVVFIHGYGAPVGFSAGAVGLAQTHWLSTFIRDIISQGIARVAVPLFFLLSGYLFFLGFQWSWENYRNKLLSRCRTLLIPFLFWNCLILLLLAVAQSLPAFQGYFPGSEAPIRTYHLYDYLNAIFGIDRFPVAYQFWFIRDLIVMVLLAPVIQVFLKTMPSGFFALLFTLWFFALWPCYVPSSTACFFFYAGAFLATAKKRVFEIDTFGNWIFYLYTVILLADVLMKNSGFHGYIHRIGLLFGIGTALYATKFALKSRQVKSLLLWATSCSFFVFAVHEPLLTLSRKLAYQCLNPGRDMVIVALYFFIPFFVITIAILAYVVLRNVSPKCLRIVTGGRL